MYENIYEEVMEKLYKLFDLVELIKAQENIIDSIIEEGYDKDNNQKIDYEVIGKRLVDYFEIKHDQDLLEEDSQLIDLQLKMLVIIGDLIKITLELNPNENAEFIDESRGLVNVDEELEDIFFSLENEDEVIERVDNFVDFHINRLMRRGMNDLVNHDFNIEDWVTLGKNKIGLYLDNSVYHHYGCWVPEKFLNHLSLPINFSSQNETELQLFFKKKAYKGILKLQDNMYMLYWDNSLRRRINKKYPQFFSIDEKTNTKQRVLMSFYYHENFEENFVKIDFELVDM